MDRTVKSCRKCGGQTVALYNGMCLNDYLTWVVETRFIGRDPDGIYTFDRYPHPMQKKHLIKGAYYVGVCRNANVARWDGEKFHHWRQKFGSVFVESIKHREDDDAFDVFDAFYRVDGNPLVQVKEIPLVPEIES